MSAEEENELIALKSRLWKLGLNPESIIPVGSADVAAFLSKYPGNVVARNWKILLDFCETKKWMKTSTNVRIFHVL